MNVVVYIGDVTAETKPGAALHGERLAVALARQPGVRLSVLGQPAATMAYASLQEIRVVSEQNADAAAAVLTGADLVVQVHPFQRRPAEVPTVVIVHDVAVHDAPWAFAPAERARLVRSLHKNLIRSIRVVTPHPFVADRVLELEPLTAGKTVVTRVPIPAPRETDPLLAADVRQRFHLDTPTPTVLYPATRRPHNNHWALLDAVAEIQRDGRALRLICAGPAGSDGWQAALHRRVRYLGIDDVEFTGYLAQAQLSAMYRDVTGVIFPGAAEGGTAIGIEAAVHSAAVACAATPGVLADLERLDLRVPTFDPFDSAEIAAAMVALIETRSKIVDGYESAIAAMTDWNSEHIAHDVLASAEQVPR